MTGKYIRGSDKACVVSSAIKLVKYTEDLEILYTATFPDLSHIDNVMGSLVECASDKIESVLCCDSTDCHQKMILAVKLYFKIRVHASLKRTNIENKESKGKRNKKLLKLMHI